jgi:hypothetical protein
MATGGVDAKLMRPSIQRICWLDGIGRGRAPHTAHVAYGSKNRSAVPFARFLLAPGEQTSSGRLGMSEKCPQADMHIDAISFASAH